MATSRSLSIDSAPTPGPPLVADSSSTATTTPGPVASPSSTTSTMQTSSSQPTSITAPTPAVSGSASIIISTTSPDPDSSQSFISKSSQSDHHRPVVPIIVGGVVGGIVLISIVVCIIFWRHRKGRNAPQTIPNHTGSVRDLSLGGRFIRPFTLSPRRHTPLDMKPTGATALDSRDASLSTGKGADSTITSNYPVIQPFMERWQSMAEGTESRPGIIRPYTLPLLDEEGIVRARPAVHFDISVPTTTSFAPHGLPGGASVMEHDLEREVAMLREHILRLEMENSALHTDPLVELEPPPTYVSLDNTAT